jgi:hypothetical protein
LIFAERFQRMAGLFSDEFCLASVAGKALSDS